jgi:hypothetical protein
MVMNLPLGLPLLAQVSREQFGRGFRGAASQRSWHDLVPYIVAAIVIGVGYAVYSHMKRRNDMTERCDDPQKLFRELCLTHQLDRPSRRLLLQLAEGHNLVQPALVFAMPAAFEPVRVPAELRGRIDEIRRLRERLF